MHRAHAHWHYSHSVAGINTCIPGIDGRNSKHMAKNCTGIAEVRARVPFRPIFRYCLSNVAKAAKIINIKIVLGKTYTDTNKANKISALKVTHSQIQLSNITGLSSRVFHVSC